MPPIAARALLLLFVVGLAAPQATAQSILDKALRNETVTLPSGEPDMAAAMREARSKLPEFLALAGKPKPSMTGFALKVGLRHANGVEFVWVNSFEIKATTFVGKVANTPREVPDIKLGQTIEFGASDIVDWMYRDDGKMKGNYTACALIKREPAKDAEAFKKRYGLECNF
jgi:uncharacterized protein YegJ (DUF2314 family)